MHPVSQIIVRNRHLWPAGARALWINPDADDAWRQLKDNSPGLRLLQQDFGKYQHFQHAGAAVDFSALPEPGNEAFRWVILTLPRQKALLKMLVECAASQLTEDGVLWLAGENKAGIKSSAKVLKSSFSSVTRLDSARHCGLFEASGPASPQAFDPMLHRQEWQLPERHRGLSVVSYPGVFAHGRLDAGTGLLLDVLAEKPLAGTVLDFACGAGPIGAFLAVAGPSPDVSLLDNSALALKASRETLAANHLHGRIIASDGLSSLEGEFDHIVSNPPIHAGIQTDNQLGMRLLASVKAHLRPGGSFIMVANIHLPYEKWLQQTFGHCVELASDRQFKVIMAKR